MNRHDAQELVVRAGQLLLDNDVYLLENDLGERCIASRLAWHLQSLFDGHHVDVEYNRAGADPKRLALPDECANYRDDFGESLVVPDIVVHRRGPDGPNLIAIEVKKRNNPFGPECDRLRIRAYREQLGYRHGVAIEFSTGRPEELGMQILDWIGD